MQLSPSKFDYERKVERIATVEFDLIQAGFGYVTNNGGIHLQISHEGATVADYWPTTSTLKFRKCSGEIRRMLKKVL